jgi:replicative DNA helicase
MQIQRSILLKFVQNKDIESITKLQENKFSGEHLRILRFLQEFVIDNKGKVPTKAILKRHYPSFARDLRHKIKEPTKYLLDELDNAHTHNTLVDLLTNMSKDLKNKDEIKPKDVLRNLERHMLELRAEVTSDNQKGQDITKQRSRIKEKLVHRRKQGGILGFHFPLPSLTKFLRGLRKKRLYTLIARTSVGKTAMSFLIAMHVWRQYNVPVLFLSGELDYEQMEDQYLSLLTGIPIHKIENGDLTEKEEKLIDDKLKEVENKAPFIFGYAGGIADVITELNTHNPEFLVVDSFYELDRFTEPDDTKRTAMTSSRLQRISREYDMPVLINSQANRATDKKKGADLSNISFSDTIGQTSDVVITMIQSEEMRMAREMEVALLKNRGGRLAKILMNWNWEEQDFSEIREIDEYGDSANDTSELTNAQVEKEAEEQKFDKLLGRERRKKKKDKSEDKPKKRGVKKRTKVDENTGRPKRGGQRTPNRKVA